MKFLSLLFLTFILASNVFPQTVTAPTDQYKKYLMASPGALKYGLYGYDNPALLTYVDGFDALFTWTDQVGKWNDFKNWGLFTGVRGLGFGVVHERTINFSVYDYKLSTGFGNRNVSLGLAYGWSSGDTRRFNRTNLISTGLMIRPTQYVSFGLTGDFSTSTNYKEAYTELAIRPLGDEKLTVFGDYTIRKKTYPHIDKDNWSSGAVFEFVPGVRITGRYFDSKAFSFGLQLSLGNLGFSSQAYYDDNQKHSFNTYSVRLGSYDRNFIPIIFPKKDYISLELKGNISYQRYKLFDNSKTLIGLLNQIDAAKEDKNITGIAINISGMDAGSEMLWELRDRLDEFKKAGKKVIIYIDRGNLREYYFASIADKIMFDPMGMIFLEGLVSGRTFYKGALEKLGIGFNEWRFFKYKSANESYDRKKMSEGDRDKREVLIDEYYSSIKNGICNARKFSPEKFDSLVNHVGVFLPQDALKLGLVDTLARWGEAGSIVKTMQRGNEKLVDPGSLEKFKLPADNHWSEFDKIAIIYALGICDMDEGISARNLSKDIEKVKNDPEIKAVVLRVDSPGGDALASDYVAEAIRDCKKYKPVIVSQGSVAGSGGYWLSMYGDTIVSAPFTITGSIGVIGGWAYNNGFKEKLGLSTDYVKKGDHADLPFGAAIPFIGISLPDRDLNEEEYKLMEHTIKGEYDLFVKKVSEGRKLSTAYVDSVGQGRIWTGTDARRLKLVDEIGSLSTAVKLAKKRAGISSDQRIKIVQYPDMPLFNFGALIPGLPGIKSSGFALPEKENETIKQLKYRLEKIGIPLTIIPVDDLQFLK
jgi:protease-4